jgi:hypothetical protein
MEVMKLVGLYIMEVSSYTRKIFAYFHKLNAGYGTTRIQ